MWKDVEMARLVAINVTQPITKEAATVKQRMNTNIAVFAHDIVFGHL
jgi:ABC-type Zn2+ transport system substrate-binding protein/surface adhesin